MDSVMLVELDRLSQKTSISGIDGKDVTRVEDVLDELCRLVKKIRVQDYSPEERLMAGDNPPDLFDLFMVLFRCLKLINSHEMCGQILVAGLYSIRGCLERCSENPDDA